MNLSGIKTMKKSDVLADEKVSDLRLTNVIVDKDFQWWFDRLAEDGILTAGQLKPSDIYTNEFKPSYKKQ